MQKIDHTKNIIELRGVSFSYGNSGKNGADSANAEDDVLHNINFEVHKGDYIGMTGANGAGKTTLLKIILNLLKPSAGTIKLFGQDIKDFKDWAKISYVPQKVANFDKNFPATVEEVVLMGRYGKKGLFNKITSEDKKICEKALSDVGMLDFKNRMIGDISGGQLQRVFIARALAGEPEVIFLDEPTSGVDEKSQNEFFALLQKLNRELDLTLILISHDLERVAKEAMHIACVDRTLVMHPSASEVQITSHHHNN
ncbi:MAG: metal ABC transporter ATP-binding protein [Candidatus Taylorbacteria bacterium]|nr:metal ABC transporter ATP-binding protein [Candidatus Taylorbacteria bacterium]